MISDVLFSIFVACFCSVGDEEDKGYYSRNKKNNQFERIEIDTSIVDFDRYKRDVETYGKSYAEIGRKNGLYSYVREF